MDFRVQSFWFSADLVMRYATNILAICVASLLALGIVMLYSAGMAQSGARFLSMQLVWGGLGLIACFAATVMDYRALKKIAFPLFIFLSLIHISEPTRPY